MKKRRGESFFLFVGMRNFTFAHGLHEDGVVAGYDEAEAALVPVYHDHSRWRDAAVANHAAVDRRRSAVR